MISLGWRNVIVDSQANLRCEKGNLIIEHEETVDSVPISDMRFLMVNSVKIQITAYLVNELIRNNVVIIFCDEKRTPIAEVTGLCNHTFSAGKIEEQFLWEQTCKSTVWQKIIMNKIHCQGDLLRKNNLPAFSVLENMSKSVIPENAERMEAQAAKIYFHALFGNTFSRRRINNINSALNYAYAILLSSFNRSIIAHGYNTCKGICHCSKNNPYNLSCDFMEAFRPFCDEYIYQNGNRVLDWNYKKEIISLLMKPVSYGGKRMELQTAVDAYTENILKALSRNLSEIKEVGFSNHA